MLILAMLLRLNANLLHTSDTVSHLVDSSCLETETEMQDDIDLGKYVRVVFTHYKFGLLLFVIVALVVAVPQLLRPASYTATATLFARTPQYQWRFDSRVLPFVQVNKNWQKEFSEVAKDPWLKRTIADALVDEYPAGLPGLVTVRAGKQTLIHVDATASTPEEAAQLANRWSEAFVGRIDQMYGTASLADPFSEELAEVGSVYRLTKDAVREFKARTGIGIASEGQTMLEGYEWLGPLGLELAEKNRLLAQHRLAVGNLQVVRDQLQQAQAAGEALDELSWELLNVTSISERGQLTLDVVVTYLEAPEHLASLIDSELTAQNSVVEILEQEIAGDQEEITRLADELDRLVESRILAKETYQTIYRKIDEIEIQSKIEGPLLQVITKAVSPADPKQTDWLMIILSAVVAGGVVGIAGCFAAEFVEARRTTD